MADRCMGHCCEDFILMYSPEELHTKMTGHKDDDFIARMVLYKGRYGDGRHPSSGLAYHYTCRYFDKTTRNCTVYDQRPAMCRDYPYNRPCLMKGCELTPELRPDSLLDNLFRKIGHRITLNIKLEKAETRLVEHPERIPLDDQYPLRILEGALAKLKEK